MSLVMRRMMRLLLLPMVLASASAWANMRVETWRAHEWTFASSGATGADVEMDVVFSCGDKVLRRPVFWDGGTSYRVRFAPPSAGDWTWRTVSGEPSLNGQSGSFIAVPYCGDLEIYRRGFVRTVSGQKHFAYADGTPFFYLGDTHWGFGREAEEDATNAAARHVETVARRRVEQGFTVWQSEPIGCSFNLADGTVDASDISGFKTYDRAFRTVADAGLVHANAQFFFPTALKEPLASDTNALRRLSRYWVARYGAYPVLWTLGQEVDNDMYYPKQNKVWTAAHNPYVVIARFLHEFDCYAHPLTAHQENTWNTTNEIEVVSVEAKHTPWRKALEFPSAHEMRHFRNFMEALPWWRLAPDFGEGRCFRAEAAVKGAFAAAADGRRVAAVYVFDRTSRATGAFSGLEPSGDYAVTRFNPRTGERTSLGVRQADARGTLLLGERPDTADWAYSAEAVVQTSPAVGGVLQLGDEGQCRQAFLACQCE